MTGKPYVGIGKQWNRLIKIASGLLVYELTGRRPTSSTSATPARNRRARA
jgi:hypothetical protein